MSALIKSMKSKTDGGLLQRNGDLQLRLTAVQTVFQKGAKHVILGLGSLLRSLVDNLARYLAWSSANKTIEWIENDGLRR